jgi:soluble lytic murein transglycosylase-like protein
MDVGPFRDLFLGSMIERWAGRLARTFLGEATAKQEPAPAPKSASVDAGAFTDFIRSACARYGVPEDIVCAVIKAESNFRADAVSPAGAKGLMQLMDGTARGLGVADSFDPQQNIEGGVKFLQRLLQRYDSVPLALAAYNAGPGAVDRYGGIPPYEETQRYVTRVMSLCGREWQA